MKKHLSILFPQWQGGGILATYQGAQSLKKNYLAGAAYTELPVEMDENLTVKNKIVGYDPIIRQLTSLKETIDREKPETLFVMGGGDDVDILPPAYCNNLAGGDMTVVFFDAHGDLNSPETSPSGNLHGMPLRSMLGDTDPAILNLMDSTLKPEQIVMVGTRDCDPPEAEYIREHGLVSLKPDAVNKDPQVVIDELKKKGKQKVFIHVDIDVIDPKEFHYQPVPAPDGLQENAFIEALSKIEKEFTIVGMCILGYTEMPEGQDPALAKLVKMGLGL